MAKGPFFTRITNFTAQAAQKAFQWFKSAVQEISSIGPIEIERGIRGPEIDRLPPLDQESRIQKGVGEGIFQPTDQTNIGQMFLFKYDPKYKLVLPYYDEYPLVFPIGSIRGGFLGINVHYLPFGARQGTLNILGELATDDKLDEFTKLDISYQILKNQAVLFDMFYKGCVRKYLYGHVCLLFSMSNQTIGTMLLHFLSKNGFTVNE